MVAKSAANLLDHLTEKETTRGLHFFAHTREKACA